MDTVNVATIEAQALSLDREARGHLATVLLRSLDEDVSGSRIESDELERFWASELDRRSSEWDADPSIGMSHDDIMARARELVK